MEDRPALQQPLCLTLDEVAQACQIKRSSVPVWVRKGVIPKPIPGTKKWCAEHLREHLLKRSRDGGGALIDDDWSI